MSANAIRFHGNLSRALRLLAAACLAAALGAGPAPAAAPARGDGGIVLSYLSPDAGAVAVVGDFNGWNPDATPLVRDADGLWSATVALPPGEQAYRFVVDGVWVEDPDNAKRAADPFGGFNSVVSVADDGSPVAVAAPAAAAAPAPAADLAKITVGAPVAVDGGVLFTYRDPSAGQVFVAGSFNGWNASDTPLTRNEQGTWAVVRKLDAGRHTYKFVVDGNWLADPENGDVEADGYGGSNSAVTVDAKGKVVAGAPAPAADARPAAATALNAKVAMGGRYLTRFELAKNIQDDPRYRLLRPSMSADLNFDVAVNDVVNAFMRLRMDSNENVILNNIVGSLDEAELHVHPGKFDVRAYWNREIFTSSDPLRLVGDVDLPGTIGHDHLEDGKGTAGAVFSARPFGIGLEGWFANVHNADYYNDPALFDNTGADRLFTRLTRTVGPVELGLPLSMQRRLTWFSFETLVGLPSTGIPSLDDYLDGSGDASTWFETEQHDYRVGLDAGLPLQAGAMKVSAQVMHGDGLGRFVTGNLTGQNNSNGGLDVPYFDREELLAGLRWDWNPDEDTSVRLEHVYTDQTGASPDERVLAISYLDQTVAGNRVYFAVDESPAQTTSNHTELEAAWRRDDNDLRIYAWHASADEDFAAVGRTVPGAADRTSRTVSTWYVSGLAGRGNPRTGYGHAELEFGVNLQDPDAAGEYFRAYEFIGRAERAVSRNWSVLADVRYIRYGVDEADPSTGDVIAHRENFWAPFAGLRFRPLRTLDLVVGYGVDPVELSIDYNGRQLGRWWHRQNYLFENPDATLLDAERDLADTRVFTLRAQLTF